MAIGFCPLEVDWGNIADWAAVAVGIGAAVGTILVATAANRTSKDAADIAKEAKDIAGQQHDQAVALKENVARILGSLLQVEIGTLPMRLGALLRDYDASVEPIKLGKIIGDTKFSAVIGEMEAPFLPAAEGVFDQIHNFPDELGASLASMMGMTRNIRVSARKVDSRVLRVSDMSGGYDIVGYKGDAKNFEALRQQIVSMLSFSIELAQSFNEFVKGEVIDYSGEMELISE